MQMAQIIVPVKHYGLKQGLRDLLENNRKPEPS